MGDSLGVSIEPSAPPLIFPARFDRSLCTLLALPGDYDNDGNLDLFVCREHKTGLLFRNLGADQSFKFSKALELGGSSCGGIAWGDYDKDGFIDIAMNQGGTKLYRNDGNGGFSLAKSWSSGGKPLWGDHDGTCSTQAPLYCQHQPCSHGDASLFCFAAMTVSQVTVT